MLEHMNPQEKSILLAKAAGIIEDRNLYYPANMALAWRVLNWAMTDTHLGDVMAMWWDLRPSGSNMLDKTPADAQRLWLDEILSMLIEAGLVEVNDD